MRASPTLTPHLTLTLGLGLVPTWYRRGVAAGVAGVAGEEVGGGFREGTGGEEEGDTVEEAGGEGEEGEVTLLAWAGSTTQVNREMGAKEFLLEGAFSE